MDMNQAAVFLAGSILTMLGFITIIIGLVIINNILHKFWKPLKIWKFDTYPPQFMQHQEPVIEPISEKDQKK